MDFLDIFALIVLLTLLLSIVAGVLVIGWLPGSIAKKRGHPQAEAIAVCGWLGLLTLGILLPVAYVWAFLKSPRVEPSSGPSDARPTTAQED